MDNAIQIRRVVTGHNNKGRSIVLGDSAIKLIATPSSTVGQAWVTDLIPADNEGSADHSDRPLSLQPPAGGAMLWIVVIPARPTSDKGPSVHDTSDLALHTTATIDYMIVLSGEITMLLDEEETTLRRSDVLIQRGTAHAWENRGSEPAVLAVTLLDAKPIVASGVVSKTFST
jgi:mannose-6-phosphate isomerase-like protein (cupin superfamily)